MEKKRFIRKLHALLNRNLGPAKLHSEGLDYWRERTFHYFTIAITLFSTAIFIYYMFFFISKGAYFTMGLFFLIFLSTVTILLLPQIKTAFKSQWVELSLFLSGTILLLYNCSSGAGLLFLFASITLTAIMSSASKTIYTLLFHTLTLLIVGAYWFSPFIAHTEESHTLTAYIHVCISYISLTILITLLLLSLINNLNFSIEKERRYHLFIKQEKEELRKATRKAEESDKLKTAFLSNMSHEIRTPMNAIIGFSNLLPQTASNSEQQREFVKLIRVNANNLLTLVDDIIDISKMESGEIETEPENFELNQLMRELYHTFAEEHYSSTENPIDFKLLLGSKEKIYIHMDRERVKKVLSNLLNNAFKFTHQGVIEMGYHLLNNYQIHFFVKDTGIGINSKEHKNIFQRFYKGENNSERLYGGTGIGLTIAKHLITHMGGTIWVEGRKGGGTNFRFVIPCHTRSTYTESIRINPSLSYQTDWSGIKILVAEDENYSYEVLKVLLSLYQAQTVRAINGFEAIEKAQKEKFNLAIIDLKMPGIDGCETTQVLKEQHPNLPVIVMTAHSERKYKKRAMESGCDAFFTKPLDNNNLIEKINHLILMQATCNESCTPKVSSI